MIFLLIKMFQFTSNCGVVIFIPLKVDYQSWEIVHNFTAAAKFFALRIIFSYLCSVSLVPYCVVFMKNFHTWELRKKKSRWTCGGSGSEKFSLFPSNRKASFLDLLSSMCHTSLIYKLKFSWSLRQFAFFEKILVLPI